jgi:hypothetical protein
VRDDALADADRLDRLLADRRSPIADASAATAAPFASAGSGRPPGDESSPARPAKIAANSRQNVSHSAEQVNARDGVTA